MRGPARSPRARAGRDEVPRKGAPALPEDKRSLNLWVRMAAWVRLPTSYPRVMAPLGANADCLTWLPRAAGALPRPRAYGFGGLREGEPTEWESKISRRKR